jgi:hypothetical protein
MVVKYSTFLFDNRYTNMTMCSDGGAKEKNGSFGSVLQCQNTTVLQISSQIPNIYDIIHSHRSECFGLLISMNVILTLQQYMILHNIPIIPHKIELFCNNKSAVDTINKICHKFINLKQYYMPNMDIIKGTLICIKEINKNKGKIILNHIDSHQDRTKTELSPIALLNVLAHKISNNRSYKNSGNRLQLTIRQSHFID